MVAAIERLEEPVSAHVQSLRRVHRQEIRRLPIEAHVGDNRVSVLARAQFGERALDRRGFRLGGVAACDYQRVLELLIALAIGWLANLRTLAIGEIHATKSAAL